MKKFYAILCLAMASLMQLQAQAPQGFNYQATVRNSSGDLIINSNVYFKFNVIQGSQTSIPVFTELHYVSTDDLGQVNLVIGQGTATTGNFPSLDWSLGSYYLGIELNTGNGYVAMGTTQLLSVPYALYAENSGNATSTIPNLQSVLAENNSAGQQQIKNLLDPTDGADAVTKSYVDALSNTQGFMNFNGWDNYQIWNDNTTFQLQPNSFLFVNADNTTLIFPDGPENCCFGDVIYIYVMQDGSTPLNFTLQPNNFPVRIPNEWSQSDSFQGSLQSGLNTIINVGNYWMVAGFDNNGDGSNNPVNEQEIITTAEVTLTGTNATDFVLSWEDIDGDGPNVPVVVGANIPAGTYAGDIQFYNKTLDPSDDGYIVTTEILEEDLDHQFFYFALNGLDAIFTYNDSDSNGNPVGQQFNLTANSGTGEFRLVMINEPDKTGNGVSDGDITNAGGETDVDIFFPITVEGNIDTTPPVINLIGDSTIELFIGDTYEDTGATAIDDTDGDITSLIIVDVSSVNTAVVGTYIVTYNVSDAAGNDATEVSRTINVLPTPTRFNQNVLIEDYTGTWSGYCPRVSHAIDLVNQQTSEAVVVAIHRGSTDPNNSFYDPYNFSAEVLENLINLQGYPTAMLNRTTEWNYPQPNNVDQVIALTSGPANVGLALSPSLDGDIMSIDVKVKFGGEFSDSEAKLVLYVLEDGLFFDQTNYTSYYGGSSVISNFEHNHVLRASLSNLTGDLIPEDEYSEDNVYQVNYTMAIPSNISVNENMTLVAFVTNESNAALNVRVANFGETQIFEEL
tara:strand:+ start:741 stop:3116 length:2376 start_codon:yes stop_codon:yes gene_type:complete